MSEFILETKGLGITFGGLKAVQNVDLTIRSNEIYGLIGPNGAGKTTVFNLLTGVYRPSAGEIIFDGKNIVGLSQEAINHAGIARTFQNIRLFNNMSVVNNVMVGLSSLPEYSCGLFTSMLRLPRHFKTEKKMLNKAKELLEIFGLENDMNNLAYNLPYGKQRKLEIARALATNPKLLLLDEPAAGMNPNETAELMDMVRFVRDNFDMTVLLIEHDLKFVSGLCDKVTVLNFGTELFKGDVSKALNDPEVVKAYIGK